MRGARVFAGLPNNSWFRPFLLKQVRGKESARALRLSVCLSVHRVHLGQTGKARRCEPTDARGRASLQTSIRTGDSAAFCVVLTSFQVFYVH